MAQAPEVRLVTEAALNTFEGDLPNIVTPLTRGAIPNGSDLDNFNQIIQVGPYLLASAGNYVNAPDGWSSTGTLEVLRSGPIAILQRATNSDGMWWRETLLGENDFSAWTRVGTEPIVSTDRATPIPAGRTLYVIDESMAAADFTDFDGVTPFWGSSGSFWGVNTNADLLDGRGTSYTGSGGAALTMNGYPNVADVDVLTRAATPSLTNTRTGGLVARASGPAIASSSGYMAFISLRDDIPSLCVGKVVSGSYSLLRAVAFEGLTIEDAYWLRFSVVGSDLRAKAWMDGATEPEGWMIGITDADLTAGLVGLYTNSSSKAAYDYLSINTGGGSA